MHKGHYRYNKRFKPFKFCFMLLNVDFKDFFHWRRAIKSKSHRLIYIIRIVSAVDVGGKKFNIFGIIVVYCCWSERRGLWEERKRTAKWKESKNTKIDGLHPGVEEGKTNLFVFHFVYPKIFWCLSKLGRPYHHYAIIRPYIAILIFHTLCSMFNCVELYTPCNSRSPQ